MILHKEDWSQVSFDFADDFLVKTDLPETVRSQTRNFVILSLQGFLVGFRGLQALSHPRVSMLPSQDPSTERGGSHVPTFSTFGSKSYVSKSSFLLGFRRQFARLVRQMTLIFMCFTVLRHMRCALATSWHFSHNLELSSDECCLMAMPFNISSFYLRDVFDAH